MTCKRTLQRVRSCRVLCVRGVPLRSLAFLADLLQIAVDAGLRDSKCGGGAGNGALEHKHAVAVEMADNIDAIGLPKRGDILPAAFEQLGNTAVDELLCRLR